MRSILTVTSPAASTNLTTLERLRLYPGLGDSVVANNVAERMIEVSSAAIATLLNQRRDQTGRLTLARETLSEVFSSRACESRRRALILGRTPVAQIDSIDEDGVVLKRRLGGADGAIDIGASATTLTSAAGPEGEPFAAAMAGQTITIAGAGAGGGDHVTAIASVDADDAVTLAAPALTSVTGAVYALDNPAWASGFAAGYEIDQAAGLLWKKSGGYRVDWTAARIEVVYSAGWITPAQDKLGAATLPLDIENAATLFVRRFLEHMAPDDYRRLESEMLPGAGTWKFALEKITWDDGLPSDVRRALLPYRRLHV